VTEKNRAQLASSDSSHFQLHAQLENDSLFVAKLTLCEVRLMRTHELEWLLLVPRLMNIRELTDVSEANQQLLWQEIRLCTRALQACFNPHKTNIAMLGNMVEQFHVHIIARYKDDPAWPKPVWGNVEIQKLPADQWDPIIQKIQDFLTFHFT